MQLWVLLSLLCWANGLPVPLAPSRTRRDVLIESSATPVKKMSNFDNMIQDANPQPAAPAPAAATTPAPAAAPAAQAKPAAPAPAPAPSSGRQPAIVDSSLPFYAAACMQPPCPNVVPIGVAMVPPVMLGGPQAPWAMGANNGIAASQGLRPPGAAMGYQPMYEDQLYAPVVPGQGWPPSAMGAMTGGMGGTGLATNPLATGIGASLRRSDVASMDPTDFEIVKALKEIKQVAGVGNAQLRVQANT